MPYHERVTTPRQSADALAPGTFLGPYRIEAELGRGATSATYRASISASPVALKVPLARYSRDPDFSVRFLQEAALGRRLQHPHIVRVLDSGEADGSPFLAMELVRGMTLKSTVDDAGRCSRRRTLEIVRDVAAEMLLRA